MILDFAPFGRFRVVPLAASALHAILTQGAEHRFRVVSGIPADAQLIAAVPTPPHGIQLVYQHESFDLIAEGKPIPEQQITLLPLPDAPPVPAPAPHSVPIVPGLNRRN